MSEARLARQSDLSEAYDRDGVAVVRRMLSPSIIRDLESGWQSMKSGIADGKVDRESRFLWGVLPEPLGSLFRSDVLVRTAQSLLRTENVALYLNRILLKDSDWSGAVSAHQDMPYFSGGIEKLAVFLPLSRTLARGGNGGLIFLKGSHRYGNLQRGTIRREIFPPMEELAPDLEVGDAVLMNFLIWHFSEAAAVPTERPMLQIVYQPASDGSYGTAKLGVPEPTLVSGTWQTRHFAAWGETTVPDT